MNGSKNRSSRKDLLQSYRERRITGGIYALRNAKTGRMLVQSTTSIERTANLFEFSRQTGSCVHPLLQEDWKAQGPGSFSLEILETLDKKDTQSEAEFAEDIQELAAIWHEKLAAANLY